MKPILTALLLTALSAPAAAECLIQANGIGGIRLGQTPAQVKQQIPRARFQRTSDGEGVGYIAITLPDRSVVLAYQESADDPDSRINQRAKITMLSTSSPACRTASGVHPGMSLQEAVGKLGRVKEIVQSEIEAREFATFQRQPAWLTIQVEDAGRYSGSDSLPRRTTRYQPNSKILPLSISAN
ncbi:hypothetical protein H9Q10_11680 [Eikenella sp. S3360]|uniref:Uncharacterized protein n=1 Tax=Eikenella glucosivorans TaxID=2766967 RepID=A0ABS0NDB0_9NEIS|nr:hypothetical protein [Eikenella glucosivorans]MBH5330323.1 hypothetical protein [Eikenella glucosivorans]